MHIEIFSNGALIGRSNLDKLDPPMGVAIGDFVATDAYDRNLHANLIEGEYVEDRGKALNIQSKEYGSVECVGISIHDVSEGLGEIEISLLGIKTPTYDEVFAEYPHYLDYYGSD